MSANPGEFRAVTRDQPCAICGKPDWCRRSADGAHECHRIAEPTVNGFARVALTPGGFGVYRTKALPPPKATSRTKVPVKPVPTYRTPEDAAAQFAAWKSGIVEAIYEWTEDWHRARIRTADGKCFCEITRHGTGWVLRGPSKPHTLYRIADVPPDGLVFICEGEKACEAGWSIGLPCVTSGAADSARSADWRPLSGRNVVVLPDHDEPGGRYAKDVVAQLHGLHPPATVRVVTLPGLGNAEDLHDFVNVHRDSRDAEDVKAEILSLAEATPVSAVGEVAATGEEFDWPEPQPLRDELPSVATFDPDLLPPSLRPWVKDIAERMQYPPDFPAVAAVIVVATLVGRKVGIRPKRHDDWLVVPNLWGMIIGPPSVMKTPAIQEALKPLKQLEVEAKKQFDRDMRDYEAEELVADERKKSAKQRIRKQLDLVSGDPMSAARLAIGEESQPPVRTRYLVNDSTVEKLGEILNENSNGVLVFRDELVGLLKALDKEGQEGARAFYLEAWNGDGRYTYDRIGRGTIDIDAAIVSILGSIQPGPLRSYLVSAVAGGQGADGLMQRFQLAVFPDVARTWRNVDRWPDKEAKSIAYDAIVSLTRLDPFQIGATTDPDDADAIPWLRFDSNAQAEFDAWRERLELHLRDGADHPVLVAHLAKYRSLIPALALLFHLVEQRTCPVGTESLDRAIRWGAYLESHARRIYSAAVSPDTVEAAALAAKITSGALPEEFALRDVYRAQWVGLQSRDSAERAAAMLIDLDWLRRVEEPTPGRTRTRYRVNPHIERTRPLEGPTDA